MTAMGRRAQTLLDGSARPPSLPACGRPLESGRPTPRTARPGKEKRLGPHSCQRKSKVPVLLTRVVTWSVKR